MPEIQYSICSQEVGLIDLDEMDVEDEDDEHSRVSSIQLPSPQSSTASSIRRAKYEDCFSVSDLSIQELSSSSSSDDDNGSLMSLAMYNKAREVFNQDCKHQKLRSSFIANNTWKNVGLSPRAAGVPVKDFDRQGDEV